ncbi:MAG: WG repeat-containing protein [Bacteroidota bacterium]
MKPTLGVPGKLIVVVAWIGFYVPAMAQDQIYSPVDIGQHIDANVVKSERLSDAEEIFFLDKDRRGQINPEVLDKFQETRDRWMAEHREEYLSRMFAPDPLFNVDVETPIDVIVTEFSKASVRVNIVFTIGHSRWHHYHMLLKDYLIERNDLVDQLFRLKQLDEIYPTTFEEIGYGSSFPEVLRTLGLNYREYAGQSPQYRNLWFPDHNLEVIIQDGAVKYLQKGKPAWVDQSQPGLQSGVLEESPDIPFPYNNFVVRYIPELGFAAIGNKGNFLFEVFPYDNGPDYPSEGLIRIRENGKIGYADLHGNIVISPSFEFAYPFRGGVALICAEGALEEEGEHSVWKESKWGAIDKTGRIIVEPFDLGLFTFNILDLKLILFKDFGGEIEARTRWGKLEEIYIFLHGDGEGLFVDLRTHTTGKQLLTYLFLPWQDLTFSTTSDHDARIPTEQLVTVTPKSIVYLVDMAPMLSEGEMDTITDLANMMHQLLEYEEMQFLIREEDGVTSRGGMQIINLKEYPNYLEVSVATPGTGSLSPDSVRMEFPRKMILLHQVPDMGAVRSNWIKPGPPEDNPAEKEEDVIRETPGTGVVEVGAGSEDVIVGAGSEPAPTNDVFPDYQSKHTPDTMLDYMPSLLEDLARLPEANIDNLGSLIRSYIGYQARAKENPGKWVEGNIALGAREKEYQPSAEELILMEIGERIGTVISENDQERLTPILKQLDKCPETVEFTRFFFIHYDVMGSGRFFYIDGMEPVSLKLQ